MFRSDRSGARLHLVGFIGSSFAAEHSRIVIEEARQLGVVSETRLGPDVQSVPVFDLGLGVAALCLVELRQRFAAVGDLGMILPSTFADREGARLSLASPSANLPRSRSIVACSMRQSARSLLLSPATRSVIGNASFKILSASACFPCPR